MMTLHDFRNRVIVYSGSFNLMKVFSSVIALSALYAVVVNVSSVLLQQRWLLIGRVIVMFFRRTREERMQISENKLRLRSKKKKRSFSSQLEELEKRT